jgi:hypothetical protein
MLYSWGAWEPSVGAISAFWEEHATTLYEFWNEQWLETGEYCPKISISRLVTRKYFAILPHRHLPNERESPKTNPITSKQLGPVLAAKSGILQPIVAFRCEVHFLKGSAVS